MAKIAKMQINGSPYELAGSGGVDYIEGDHIHIIDGVISADYYDDTSVKALISGNTSELGRIAGLIVSSSEILMSVNNLVEDKLASFVIDEDQILAKVVEGLDSEGGFTRKSEYRQTTSEFDYKIWDLASEGVKRESEWQQTAGSFNQRLSEVTGWYDSEGQLISEGILSKYESNFTQTINAFTWTFSQELEGINNNASRVLKQMSFGADDGLKIAAGDISTATSYTKITEDGMEIWSQDKKVAEATGSRFVCNKGLGVVDWIITTSTGTLGNKVLNIFRG